MTDQEVRLNTFTDEEIEKHLVRLAAELSFHLEVDEDDPKFQAIGAYVVRATERMINGTFTDGIDTNSLPSFSDVWQEQLDEEFGESDDGPHLSVVPDPEDDDDDPDITGSLWPDGV